MKRQKAGNDDDEMIRKLISTLRSGGILIPTTEEEVRAYTEFFKNELEAEAQEPCPDHLAIIRKGRLSLTHNTDKRSVEAQLVEIETFLREGKPLPEKLRKNVLGRRGEASI